MQLSNTTVTTKLLTMFKYLLTYFSKITQMSCSKITLVHS